MRFFSLLSFLPTDRREEREIIPVQRSSLASQQKYALSGGSTVYESTHAVVISLTRNATVDTSGRILLPSSSPRGVARYTGVDTLRDVIASLPFHHSSLDFTRRCLKSECMDTNVFTPSDRSLIESSLEIVKGLFRVFTRERESTMEIDRSIQKRVSMGIDCPLLDVRC